MNDSTGMPGEISNLKIEKFTKATEKLSRESKVNTVRNGFFGNVIVPMQRANEMEFICKPMESKESVKIFLNFLIFLKDRN